MSYLWATVTHRGRMRPANQDRVYPDQGGRHEGPLVFVVADGMGGHVGGEVAAGLAVEAALAASGPVDHRVRQGNQAILDEVWRQPALAGMGTTMTLVELGPDRVARLAHVGDSRAYLLADGILRRLTRDHTVVADHVEAGRISPDEVATHPHRSMLTRALGLEDRIAVDTHDEPVEPGDRLLLCSDGLSSMVDDGQIAELVAGGSPEEAAWRLVEAANLAGGHDNVTVIVVDVA